MVLRPLELVLRRMLKSLKLKAKAFPQCCKQNAWGHSGGSWEDQNAERNAEHRELAHATSEGTRILLGTEIETFWQDSDSFCSCPENLDEAEFKSNRLVCLAEEMSREGSIWTVTVSA